MVAMYHAVRRSVEHPAVASFVKRAMQEAPKIEVPQWGVFVIGLTVFVIVVGLSALEYTLKNVVATLAMVETPSAAITVSASEESAPKDIKEDRLESGPVITLVHQKPITSSIRGTIRHLVSNAGGWSRFRGIKLQFLYALCFSIVFSVFEGVTPHFPGRMVFVSGVSGALLANLHATWTHKVIGMPTSKPFLQRLVPRSNWKVLALPAAIQASAGYLSIYIAKVLVVLMGIDRTDRNEAREFSRGQWAFLVFRLLSVAVIMVSCGLFFVLPALVTLIRTEASLLPEDQDTIVPFDRTFNGKVVPKILGGTGAVGFVDAWKSFNWEARGRLLKLYVKIFAILTTLVFVMINIVAFETWAIMGPALAKFLAQMQKDGYVSN